MMKSSGKQNEVRWPKLSGCDTGLLGKKAGTNSEVCSLRIWYILQGTPEEQQASTSSDLKRLKKQKFPGVSVRAEVKEYATLAFMDGQVVAAHKVMLVASRSIFLKLL